MQNEDGTKTEYRVWNPFRSKLAAAILGGVDNIWIVSTSSAEFHVSLKQPEKSALFNLFYFQCFPKALHFFPPCAETRGTCAVSRSCFRNNRLSCLGHCWTSKLYSLVFPPCFSSYSVCFVSGSASLKFAPYPQKSFLLEVL